MAGRPLLVHGDGAQTRDFSYVADTARGILLAAQSEKAIGETINIGNGKEISINALAESIGAVVRCNDLQLKHGPARPGDVLRLYADSGKAASLLGFAPQISLREGLSRLKLWYEDSGVDPSALLAEEIEANWQPVSRGG
jgi:UDP-glucose 4-epimerase